MDTEILIAAARASGRNSIRPKNPASLQVFAWPPGLPQTGWEYVDVTNVCWEEVDEEYRKRFEKLREQAAESGVRLGVDPEWLCQLCGKATHVVYQHFLRQPDFGVVFCGKCCAGHLLGSLDIPNQAQERLTRKIGAIKKERQSKQRAEERAAAARLDRWMRGWKVSSCNEEYRDLSNEWMAFIREYNGGCCKIRLYSKIKRTSESSGLIESVDRAKELCLKLASPLWDGR